ncbi:MAG: ribosomal RNA small subunit methyltransferase A [Armatimonadetes bacterium]|nr:ribosomal RNA small subunit methyltransferase A [Armatimonadota bacterium]
MNLDDPGALKRFLAKHDLAPRKGLGQHFLCSSRVVNAIVAACADCKGILEIGPGPGVLTGPLSEAAQQLVALEVDERVPAALAESAPKAKVVMQDALEADLGAILSGLPEPRAVVSNLPYYITGPLITRIAEAAPHYDMAVLMMQKEVAERILAKPGNSNRGSLSVYLQFLFDIAKVVDAPGGAFMPPPKVDSLVLKLTPRRNELGANPAVLFPLVRMAFGQPRKTLRNNLLGDVAIKGHLDELLAEAGIQATLRPHQLEDSQWLTLANLIDKLKDQRLG